MKNFKKVVAAGLALLMLALSVNVTFAAEEYTDKEAVVVAKVNAAGIMTGTDKGFEPSKTLTRAEAAAIFVRMKGISEATVKQNAGTTLFTDVAASHWAAGYVNVASNYGIIKGVGANKFAPEKEVTVAEFYTMAVRALNAGQLVESEGTWPTNYVNFAIENDLAEDVAQLYTAASTRMTAATIVANTLKAPMWEKSAYVNNGEITFTKGDAADTILKALNIKEYEKVKFSGIDTKKLTVNTDCAAIAAAAVDVDVNERAALGTAKEGIQYTVWYDTKEEEILGFWVPSSTEAITFTNIKVDYNASTKKAKLLIDGKEKEYEFVQNSAKTYFELNGDVKEVAGTPGAGEDPFNTAKWADLKKADMPVFGVAYLDEDGKKIEKVYAETYNRYGVVKDATSARITFEKAADIKGTKDVSTITINKDDEKDYQYFVTKDGKAIDINDIEEGDVLFYYTKGTNNHTFVIDVYEETVEGKVSSTNGSKITIDGTKYDAIVAGIKAGDEGTFYLNNDGKIVMYELEAEKEGNYAVISELRNLTASYSGEKDLISVKLATLDGEITDFTRINYKKSFTKVTATADNLDEINDNKGNSHADYTVDDEVWKVLGKYYDTEANAVAAIAAGVVVQYEIKDSKVVLKDTEAVYFEDFTDAKIDFLGAVNSEVYLNSNTKAYEVNQYENGKFKLIEVTIDDLDTDTDATGYYGDYDKNENEAGYVFFTSEVAKTAESNWAFILDASYDYDNGDDESDIDSIYEVIYADGTPATLYADSTSIKLTKGNLYELTLRDDEITRAKTDNRTTLDANELVGNVTKNAKLSPVDLAGKYVHEVKDNGLVTFIAVSGNYISGNATRGYALSDNVLVIKVDDDGDYTVSDFESIAQLTEDDSTVELDLDEFNAVSKVISFTDDNETEVVLLVYAE